MRIIFLFLFIIMAQLVYGEESQKRSEYFYSKIVTDFDGDGSKEIAILEYVDSAIFKSPIFSIYSYSKKEYLVKYSLPNLQIPPDTPKIFNTLVKTEENPQNGQTSISIGNLVFSSADPQRPTRKEAYVANQNFF